MKSLNYLLYSILIMLIISCSENIAKEIDTQNDGVSYALASSRKNNFSNVEYKLHFNIPSDKEKIVTGEIEIKFNAEKNIPIVIDFKATNDKVKKVSVNGSLAKYNVEKEHIILDKKYCKKGENIISIDFISNDKSLNRRDDFLYTLLVPDRARTLFPLFDQPNMKARYSLSLTVPADWKAISNSNIVKEINTENSDSKTVVFDKTEPISSYLFSFVTGVFDMVEKEHNGRIHRIYHRENDPKNIAQLEDIYSELFHSLDWLENYTTIKYPFSKYDLILIPGFQYGGMEHVGATIYNATTMFLSPTPTVNEQMARVKLIAHETAHMWFGDLVTMEWFDDVWTKEVFANYFAAKITAPLFPNIDQSQTMINYVSAAMSEDRTTGGQPIKQNLDNLKYAGLIYNNIIYNKSPLVFNMIAEKLGEEAFQKAVIEYLQKYSYDCASWDKLVAIFDKYSNEDIEKWSKPWMYESSMPTIETAINGNKISVMQSDKLNRDIIWGQNIEFMAIDDNGEYEKFKIYSDKKQVDYTLNIVPKYIIPNTDGRAYGYFKMDSLSMLYAMAKYSKIESDVMRQTLLITLNENMLNGNLKTVDFFTNMTPNLLSEKSALQYSSLLNYLTNCYVTYMPNTTNSDDYKTFGDMFDTTLWKVYNTSVNGSVIYSTFKTIYKTMLNANTEARIYQIWSKTLTDKKLQLGERDYVDMSLELAIRMPDRAEDIKNTQLERIKNIDTKKEYLFVSKSISPKLSDRTTCFNELLDVKNRGVESWTSKTVRYLTHHNISDKEKVVFISKGLNIIEEIQKTGDIFFPQAWSASLLTGSYSSEELNEVKKYLDSANNLHPLLKSKISIASDHLYRLSVVR